MTHTLHRRGTEQALEHEYVVLAMAAKGVNREGSAPKLARILEIFAAHNPVNYGNVSGNSHTADLGSMLAATRENTVSHAVFASEEDLAGVLSELKKEDLGVSIVVSGLFNNVHRCLGKVGLAPHTVNLSLGVFGKKERLPAEGVLEVATMCGHGMVAFSLIEHEVRNIIEGWTSPEAAARKLARNCHCGVFNWRRAAAVLQRLADGEAAADLPQK